MGKVLNNLRSKSDAHKNTVAIVLAAFLTLVIIGIWFLIIKNKNSEPVAKENSTAQDLKPLFMIFKNAGKDFKEVKEGAINYTASIRSAKKDKDNNLTE